MGQGNWKAVDRGRSDCSEGAAPSLTFMNEPIDGLSMSHEDETWQIIGTFVIVCAMLSALIMAL